MKLILALVVATSAQHTPTDDDRAEFAKWKIQHGKGYANGEEEMRLQNYLLNRAKAADLDVQNPLANFGVNEFSDLSEEEFAVYHNAKHYYAQPRDPSVPEWPAYSEKQVAKALEGDIDWVAKGAVTPVKNQGQCGSCWAFSATGNIEGQWQIAGHPLVSVSEQQLVDCDHNGDQGCQGGLPENAFRYVMTKGLETEQQYPYTGRGGSCEGEGSPAVHIDSLTTIQRDEGQMLTFLQQKGPISIGVDAGQFQSYRSGIMTSCSGRSLDHGVLIVGYGTQGGQAYWKIKNSWGRSFGESGYIRVSYGENCAGLKNDASSSVVNGGQRSPEPTRDYEKMWRDFKAQYGKTYNGNGTEEARFAIFRTNVDFIETTNAQELGYKLEVNQFADLTDGEVTEQYTGVRGPAPLFEGPYLGEHVVTDQALPDSVDWTAQGKVTPVKNQGQCGSCWAFSSTGALESATMIATGTMVSLSEQQLVDCHVGNGCSGGWPYNSFRYAESTAMCTESEYPYTARDGSCHANSCTGLKRGAVTGYKSVAKIESDLRSAVAKGPVSITVQAGGGMSRYKSGVLTGGCSGQINHAVLAVGYGILDGTQYWKVKNSWGSSWGMDGYFLLQRGGGGQGAYCVLQDSPTYPVVASGTIVV